jgi:hypothetical protein
MLLRSFLCQHPLLTDVVEERKYVKNEVKKIKKERGKIIWHFPAGYEIVLFC